jgi:aspartokinase/homoserine dehydrogenase 1
MLLTQGSSGLSICIAVMPQDGPKAEGAIKKSLRLEIFDGRINEITAEEDLSIVAVVGEDMRHTPGISGKVFDALCKNGINIIAIAQGSSELNISFVIKREELSKTLNVLHDALLLAQRKVYNLFLVGTGLVGKALLQYLSEKKRLLLEDRSIEIKLAGLANSSKMLIANNGIEYDKWNEQLLNSDQPSNMELFVEQICKLNLANSIFVDCTANEAAVPYYLKILESNISITTPNKIANSKDYDFYLNLKRTATKSKVKFIYSTNVGAGLPIIRTIQEIVESGEKIIKIEGVLSGTLSYLFNSFQGDIEFSKLVKKAKENGYTEPDPRDDLNGLDVARKLLILVREIGKSIELDDIEVESLVPENVTEDMTVDQFLDVLEENDKQFSKKRESAEERDGVLRYLAIFENEQASVGLKEVTRDHPFYNLSDNDNIVAIYTENYSEQPIVLRGRGAGAAFTASGIFADILRITKYLG